VNVRLASHAASAAWSSPPVAPAKCTHCPHHSDVSITSREAHYTPDHGPYTTFTAIQAFHATRVDWVYSTNGSFVEDVQAQLPPGAAVTLAMNPQVPDPDGRYTIGRVKNIHGEPLDAPWMREWGSKPYYVSPSPARPAGISHLTPPADPTP
jgi:hypothetical protein